MVGRAISKKIATHIEWKLGENMIIEDPDKKKELDKIPDVDENGDPIYKIDNMDEPGEESADIAEESEFKDTPQDLKDETSQD
jgi:hypothetical protein